MTTKSENFDPYAAIKKNEDPQKNKDLTSLNLKWHRYELINYRSATKQPKIPKILANS